MQAKTIRNICVIANVDAGKSSISDSILLLGGLISEKDAGTKRATDTREDEKERGITIKSTGVSLSVTHKEEEYNINLVDTPGHCDFSSEVTAAIRITDGALLIVDCVEGVCVQTETVLRQAIAEKVKLLLVINKMDRYFFELKLSPEEAYTRLSSIIKDVNTLLQTYSGEDEEEDGKEMQVLSPVNGNVIFVSAFHQWGFSLETFAHLYSNSKGKAQEQKVNKSKVVHYLWNGFIDPKTRKQSPKHKDGYVHAFSELIYKPIQDFIENIMQNKIDDSPSIFSSLVPLHSHDLKEKKLYGYLMKSIFPLPSLLLTAIIEQLPNPQEAQKYRAKILYPVVENDTYRDIQNCNPQGQLVVYISKMIPTGQGGKFYAMGRIFSGTIKVGQKVKILDANYDYQSPQQGDIAENKSIQKLVMVRGAAMKSTDSASAGQIIAIIGIDEYLRKSGTILQEDTKEVFPIRTMKFTVNPVVHISVKPQVASDMPKLMEGMNRLSKSDPCVKCYTTKDTKEQIIAGVGELHLEICIKDLQDFMKGMKINVSKPIVPLKETISITTPISCLAKSPNKLNRIWFTAEPLCDALVQDIEANKINVKDLKQIQRQLVEKYKWTSHDAKKIWAFAEENGTNVLVDMTKGTQYLKEISESVISTFHEICYHGPLMGEPLRGIRFNLMDAQIHADSSHRNTTQIGSAVRNALLGTILHSKPKIVEPFYSIQVQIPATLSGIIYSTLSTRRGKVIGEERMGTTPLIVMDGFVPVYESFGLDRDLKAQTSGKAFLQLVVSHWETLESETLTGKLIQEVRTRKRLKEEIPQPSDFLDKL